MCNGKYPKAVSKQASEKAKRLYENLTAEERAVLMASKDSFTAEEIAAKFKDSADVCEECLRKATSVD